MNKKVLIIYTGGTIGMSKTEHGYAPEMTSFLNNLNKKLYFLNQTIYHSWPQQYTTDIFV